MEGGGMKRDMDLVRGILLRIEELGPIGVIRSLKQDGFSRQEIEYHLRLLINGELVDGQATPLSGYNYAIRINGLTWEGHDFLDAIRDDSIWSKMKEKASHAGQDIHKLPLEMVKSLAVSALKELPGLG